MNYNCTLFCSYLQGDIIKLDRKKKNAAMRFWLRSSNCFYVPLTVNKFKCSSKVAIRCFSFTVGNTSIPASGCPYTSRHHPDTPNKQGTKRDVKQQPSVSI